MSLKYFLVLSGLLVLLCACSETNEPNTESTSSEQERFKENIPQFEHYAFTEQILIGTSVDALHKIMDQYPYEFLAESEFFINYQAEDKRKVHYFVSFHKNLDDANELVGFALTIDFQKSNSEWVNRYQEMIQRSLDASYGEWSEQFETGYNSAGDFEAEWIFEAGMLKMTVYTNKITVDLSTH